MFLYIGIVIPLLGMYPKYVVSAAMKHLCMQIDAIVLFIMQGTGNNLKYPAIEKWFSKLTYVSLPVPQIKKRKLNLLLL